MVSWTLPYGASVLVLIVEFSLQSNLGEVACFASIHYLQFGCCKVNTSSLCCCTTSSRSALLILLVNIERDFRTFFQYWRLTDFIRLPGNFAWTDNFYSWVTGEWMSISIILKKRWYHSVHAIFGNTTQLFENDFLISYFPWWIWIATMVVYPAENSHSFRWIHAEYIYWSMTIPPSLRVLNF